MVVSLDTGNFQQTIESNDIVIIDFWAPWCGPCKSFGPVFERVAARHADVVFAKVDTEQQQELAGYFNIRSIPTLMVFREKVILFAEAGALPESALDELVTQVKALDMAQVHADIAAQAEGAAQPQH